jgi:type IX secretion system PorP/SprF family membrane protein
LSTLFCRAGAQAQDYMLSQYFNSPMSLNPGLTGFMRQDFRAGIIQRNQWTQAGSPYITSIVSAEASFKLGSVQGVSTESNPYLGVGFQGINDQLGNGLFTTQQALMSLSYIQPFGSFYRHKIGFGLQGGYFRKGLVDDNLFFYNQINREYNVDLSIPSGERFNRNTVNTFTAAAGAHYSFLITKKTFIYLGGSIFNFNRPKEQYNAVDSSTFRIKPRTYGNVGMQITITKRLVMNPSIAFQQQYSAREVNIGTSFAYQLNKVKSIQGLENQSKVLLYGGLYYRVDGSIIPYTALRYKNIFGSVSYDVNVNSLSQQGASIYRRSRLTSLEFALIYSGYFSRSQDRRYTLSCEDFY